MIGIKRKWEEKEEGSKTVFNFRNNESFVVNGGNQVSHGRQSQKHNDQLYKALIGMSITLIKCSLIEMMISCSVHDAQRLMCVLDKILLFYDMAQALREFIINNNLPFFKTVNTLKLFKTQQKCFEAYVLNVREKGNAENVMDFYLALRFVNNGPDEWEANDLMLFIKYCSFCFFTRCNIPLLSNKVATKFLNENISGRSFLNYGSKQLLELADFDDNSYIVLLKVIKWISILYNIDCQSHIQKQQKKMSLKNDIVNELAILDSLYENKHFKFTYDISNDDSNWNDNDDNEEKKNNDYNQKVRKNFQKLNNNDENTDEFVENYSDDDDDRTNFNNSNSNDDNNCDNGPNDNDKDYIDDNDNGKQKSRKKIPKYDKNQLEKFTVRELKVKLKSNDLNQTGNKEELIERLTRFYKKQAKHFKKTS